MLNIVELSVMFSVIFIFSTLIMTLNSTLDTLIETSCVVISSCQFKPHSVLKQGNGMIYILFETFLKTYLLLTYYSR